jgi:phosphate transport system substrate-binding protein
MIPYPIKNIAAITIMAVLLVAGVGCKQKSVPVVTDSPFNGTIHISVDESFKPVIEEQIKVYEGTNPGTHIIAHYKPEAECIKDLIRDSLTRMIIVTRGLTSKEEHYFEDSIGYVPNWDRVATDAIAVVLHQNSADSVFSAERLRKQLSGQMGYGQQIVFDGLSATSTVRYAMDTLLQGKPFDTGVVKAVKSSADVLNYVAANQNAIGVIGISWIGNPEDSAQLQMLKKVKLAYVKCPTCSDSAYVKPSQFSIMARRYPLVRGLYYIVKENYHGLGSGFMNFLKYERGQLVFRRAYLWPGKIDFYIRTVKINEKLKKD